MSDQTPHKIVQDLESILEEKVTPEIVKDLLLRHAKEAIDDYLRSFELQSYLKKLARTRINRLAEEELEEMLSKDGRREEIRRLLGNAIADGSAEAVHILRKKIVHLFSPEHLRNDSVR